MSIKASEISDLIKARIENFKSAAEARNVGTVVSVTDGIVRIHGLADVRYGEMIEFPGNTFGLALNLEQDSVGAVVLGDYKHISEGGGQDHGPHPRSAGRARAARPRGRRARPSDRRQGPDQRQAKSPLGARRAGRDLPQERVAAGADRLKAIDSMVPIGRGQRELIIGDRQTGKTAVAIDTIINQKSSGVKCIYVAIGQKQCFDRERGAQARGARRDGAHHHRGGLRLHAGRHAVPRALLRVRRWASTSWTTARMR